MGEQQPKAKDRLGEDIEDSVGNDLAVNANGSGSISDTPDAIYSQRDINKIEVSRHTLGRWSIGPE